MSEVVLMVWNVLIEYEVDLLVKVVCDVFLMFYCGEIFGFVGEFGCGKIIFVYGMNWLLKVLVLMIGGEIVFYDCDGYDIDIVGFDGEGLCVFCWDKILMVFQGVMNLLNLVISVKVQIFDIFDMYCFGMLKKVKQECVEELFMLVGVDLNWLMSFLYELLGGMWQCMMIVMVFVLDLQVMIMDELMIVLDVVVQWGIIWEIMCLWEWFGFVVIFIMYDLLMLIEISDWIVVMLQGCIVEEGIVEEIYCILQYEYMQWLLLSFLLLMGEWGDFVCIGVNQEGI